jgi:hypothetical protein
MVSGRCLTGPFLLGGKRMAYDRYDTRDGPRDERSRWSGEHDSDRSRRGDNRGQGRHDDRGFFERAGDEISSWFGDEDAERRRREDRMQDERENGDRGRSMSQNRDYDRGYGRDWNRDRSEHRDRDRDWNDNRGVFASGGSSERDYNRGWRRELGWGPDRNRDFGDRDRGGYRPMTGDYGRSERGFGGERSDSEWARDPYRRTSRAGTSDQSDRSRHERGDFDPHYRSWRDRHMSELDRDYDDYRRENQSRFESEFGSWRERRQQKRGMLGQIREHMEVVGKDEQHVGKVDKVAGDRIILAKSDPESGGVHHSLSCSEVDRVEGDRVILDCSADEARHRWRDESRSRALFERDDQGEMGPRMLDRSFEGTYR